MPNEFLFKDLDVGDLDTIGQFHKDKNQEKVLNELLGFYNKYYKENGNKNNPTATINSNNT
jgi:hypothetical protein